jgi:hypothetical protein
LPTVNNVAAILDETAMTRLICVVAYNWYLAVEGKEAPDGGWPDNEIAIPQFHRFQHWLLELAMCMALAEVKKAIYLFFI